MIMLKSLLTIKNIMIGFLSSDSMIRYDLIQLTQLNCLQRVFHMNFVTDQSHGYNLSASTYSYQ